MTPVASPFSLLLPVYAADRPEHLLRAFESATAEQTLPPSEAVVVRDGPVPAPLQDLLDRLRRESVVPVRLIELAENVGLAAALTVGIAECAHEVIARMDADDIAMPSRFAVELAAIDAGLDLVGSGMVEFADDEDAVIGRRTPPLGEARIRSYARIHDPFNHPTVVYRRAAVQRAGGYEAVGLMEDYWLFVRMIVAGAAVGNVADPLVKYRVGAGAYRRRGGIAQLRAELALQRRFRRLEFTTPAQFLRNVFVRGGYRLLPESVRRVSYRSIVQRGFRAGAIDRVATHPPSAARPADPH